MQTQAPVRPPSGEQLSFNDTLFDASASARFERPVRRAARKSAAAPDVPTVPPLARSATRPAGADGLSHPLVSKTAVNEDFATDARANAYELRARLRNSLTALSTATLLMVKHAPDSPMMDELGAIMRRQIALLSQQMQTLEDMAAHCDSAEI